MSPKKAEDFEQSLTVEQQNKLERKAHPELYFDSPVGHIRDRIKINESPDIPKEGLFISLNGFPFLAKPGFEIDIPRPVRLMLDTRIETKTYYDENQRPYTRDIPRITYILIKENVNAGKVPSAAVIDNGASNSFSVAG